MPGENDTVAVYLELADRHQGRGQSPERDRFLLLAADAALSSGRTEQAERLRNALLSHNPNHMIRPYPSLADAMQSADIASYVRQLRRTYPAERAQALLGDAEAPAMQVAAAPASQPPAGKPPSIFRMKPEEPARKRPSQPDFSSLLRPQQPRPRRPSGGWVGIFVFAVGLAGAIALFANEFVVPFILTK